MKGTIRCYSPRLLLGLRELLTYMLQFFCLRSFRSQIPAYGSLEHFHHEDK